MTCHEDEPCLTLDAGYKVVLTIAILASAIIIGAIVAKLVGKWYKKKQVKKMEEAELDEEARNVVRTRLAIMQFKRQRLSIKELSKEELSRRKSLGIWSFNGGKRLGPLKPSPLPSPQPPRNSVMVVNQDETNKENLQQQKSEALNTQSIKAVHRPVEPIADVENADNSIETIGGKTSPDTEAAPLTQSKLVQEVNKNTPTLSLDPTTNTKSSIETFRSTTPTNPEDSHRLATPDGDTHSVATAGSESHSGRKLFTHVVPNFDRQLTGQGSMKRKGPSSVKSLGQEKPTRVQSAVRPKTGNATSEA